MVDGLQLEQEWLPDGHQVRTAASVFRTSMSALVPPE